MRVPVEPRNGAEPLPGAAFLAFPESLSFLLSELRERECFSRYGEPVLYGDLVYCPDTAGTALGADAVCENKDGSALGAGATGTAGIALAGAACENETGTALGGAAGGIPATAATPAANSAVPYWARTALLDPVKISFESIGEAAHTLRDIQRNWAPYQFTQFRRAQLIQEKLPYINLKPRVFPFTVPQSPVGVYTLLDAHAMIAAARTTSVFPAGLITLQEDHENPPSRAYLKLEEALVRFAAEFGEPLPNGQSRCFDAGACPGGWTWVLRQLGATVFAVDRAPLAEQLMADPAVTFQKHDAFTLKPADIGPFDWVFSDVICYPERLYDWVQLWLESGLTRNMICTIKMQGGTDWPLVEKFAAIPGSRVVHLCYNKHELTWMHSGGAETAQQEGTHGTD